MAATKASSFDAPELSFAAAECDESNDEADSSEWEDSSDVLDDSDAPGDRDAPPEESGSSTEPGLDSGQDGDRVSPNAFDPDHHLSILDKLMQDIKKKANFLETSRRAYRDYLMNFRGAEVLKDRVLNSLDPELLELIETGKLCLSTMKKLEMLKRLHEPRPGIYIHHRGKKRSVSFACTQRPHSLLHAVFRYANPSKGDRGQILLRYS
jgi:hypothetical protein